MTKMIALTSFFALTALAGCNTLSVVGENSPMTNPAVACPAIATKTLTY